MRLSRGSAALLIALGLGLAIALTCPEPSPAQAPYRGPLIDAHSHLPNLQVLDAYVDAMKRNNVARVLLLGVGGVQKQDVEWIAAAAKRYPDRIIQAAPIPDPLSPAQADKLDALLASRRYRAAGEVHIRQVSRRIDRRTDDPAFGQVLEVAAKHGVPVAIHAELTAEAARGLETALQAHPKAMLILAHGGSAEPPVLEGLLGRHANLMVDLSGMHYLRTPKLASETGPLDPAWKALIEKLPDRFLMGIDVWAPRLFEPATLNRLIEWTRRILGELRPEVAEKVAYKNAARLFRLE
ncbi:MAG: amidohydrolase family protein [Candidatus Rokubacteria bacterium]|nr:amidohydrolase family protein [Candidatus Rokubacteria bacterium]